MTDSPGWLPGDAIFMTFYYDDPKLASYIHVFDELLLNDMELPEEGGVLEWSSRRVER